MSSALTWYAMSYKGFFLHIYCIYCGLYVFVPVSPWTKHLLLTVWDYTVSVHKMLLTSYWNIYYRYKSTNMSTNTHYYCSDTFDPWTVGNISWLNTFLLQCFIKCFLNCLFFCLDNVLKSRQIWHQECWNKMDLSAYSPQNNLAITQCGIHFSNNIWKYDAEQT